MAGGPLSSYLPEMSDAIQTLIDQMLMQLFVCLPAKVVSYDPDTQYADVQIQLLKSYNDFTTQPHPVIPNVPVKQIRANGGAVRIHIPLVPGDDVTLVFSQRSLDNWKTNNPPLSNSGGGVDTHDVRKHHITDAYALIGGSAMPDAFEVDDPTAIEIVNGETKFSLLPGGTFKFDNGTGEFVSLVQQALQTLSTDTVNTIFGPTQLNGFETYAQIAEKIQTMVAE